MFEALFSQEKAKTDTTPNFGHIIWLGSDLRPLHKERLKKWVRLNPLFFFYLWIDKDIIPKKIHQSIRNFCNQNYITLRDVSELETKDNSLFFYFVRAIYINGETPNQVTNFSIPADVFRYMILKKEGGWYFDTDIEPKNPLPLDYKLPYGFKLHLEYDELREERTEISPAVMVSHPNSIFVQKALEILDVLIRNTHYSIVEQGNSSVACTRFVVAVNSTGFAAKGACGRLLINSKVWFDPYSPKIDTDIAKNIAIAPNANYFTILFERAYIFQDEKKQLLSQVTGAIEIDKLILPLKLQEFQYSSSLGYNAVPFANLTTNVFALSFPETDNTAREKVNKEKTERLRLIHQHFTREARSAETCVTIVLLCDGYLQYRQNSRPATDVEQKNTRFFQMAAKLPLEVQKILTNYSQDLSSKGIPAQAFDDAYVSVLRSLL